MRRFQSRAEAALAVALGGVLLYSAVRLVEKAYFYLRSPFARDYGEGCVLMMVQLFDQRGGNYFVDLRDYPFIHANYPPVFIALVWPFYRLFGPSLWAPRLLSVAATLGLLVALYLLLERIGGGWRRYALALTGVAACPWFFQTWAPMGRVDMWAFLLSIGGLLAFVRGASYAVVFPLFWLGFFTKQNALLAPAAVLLQLFFETDRRTFLRALAAFVLPLAAIFGGLDLATHHGLFRHLVTYTAAADYEWTRMITEYIDFARLAWPLLVVIAAAPAAFVRGHGRLILIYWLLNMAALSTIAKAGAAQNYLIEPWLATVALAAVALPVVAARSTLPREWAMGLLLLAAGFAHWTQNWAHRLPQAIARPERAADFQRLWAAVRAETGPILSENAAVLVVNRKPVLVESHGILLLTKKGLFDPAPIVRDCEAERFALVVAERRFEETPGLGECLARRYRARETLGPYRLMVPERILSH